MANQIRKLFQQIPKQHSKLRLRPDCYPQTTSEIILPAVRLFQKLTQILRLTLSENFKKEEVPAGVIGLLAHTGEVPDFQRLEHEIQTLQQQVRTSFNSILET